jgi:hypothetical protein
MNALRIPFPVLVWTLLVLTTTATFVAIGNALQEGRFLF